MGAAVHSFPAPARKKTALAPVQPSLQTIDAKTTESFLATARVTLAKAEQVFAMLGADREALRRAGVDSQALELVAILEGGRLGAVEDALEEAVLRGTSASISEKGLNRLHRAQRLVAGIEAALGSRIAPRPPARLAQAALLNPVEVRPPSSSAWVLPALFGVFALGALVVVYYGAPEPPPSALRRRKPLPRMRRKSR